MDSLMNHFSAGVVGMIVDCDTRKSRALTSLASALAELRLVADASCRACSSFSSCSVEPSPGGVWGSVTGTAGTAAAAGWDGTTGERLSGAGELLEAI